MPLPSIQDVKNSAVPKGAWNTLDTEIADAIDVAARLYAAMPDAPDYQTLVRLHAAHFIYMDQDYGQNDGNGPLTSASAGEVSASFGGDEAAQLSDDLSGSPMGRKLRQLRAAQGPFVAAGHGPAPRFRGQ